MRKAKISLSVAVVGALAASGVMAAPSANAAPKKHILTRTAPQWTDHARSLGRAPASGTSTFRVYLAPRGGMDALRSDVARLSDPSSATFRHFLSARQFHAKYDAGSAAVRQVSAFLRDHHLSVSSVERHHRYLSVRGSNAAVNRAFDVTMTRYHHRGRTVQANASALKIPATLASSVLTVTGLDTTPHLLTHASRSPKVKAPAGFRNARPCSRFYGQVSAKYQADLKTPLPKFRNQTLSYSPCGYTGPQFRAAYEGDQAGVLNGTGVNVAVIDAYASPTIAADAGRYASDNGDAGYGAGQLTQTVPNRFTHKKECGETGWYGEETLDIEAVHAMAGDAGIRYYGAQSCYDQDFLDTQTQVIDDNDASIVTNSYGEPEEALTSAAAAAEQELFLQAASQGISFMFSSGDSGDEVANTGLKQADASATDPYVTAVGGTADAIGPSGSFLFQTGWGTNKYSLSADGKSWSPVGFLYGAGGGSSSIFQKPDYQNGVVPNSYGAGRQVPDIAMDADPSTGMLVGETQKFSDGTYYDTYRIGGTSLASPLFAGMAALASEHAGTRLGLLNPVLYKQAGSGVFRDIAGAPRDSGVVRADFVNGEDATGGLTYSVRTFNEDSSLAVRKGWDNVTGVGSPNSTWLTSLSK